MNRGRSVISGDLGAEAEALSSGWGAPLDPAQWDLLDRYLADVLEYNRKTNLTADAEPSLLVRRHALDALAAVGALKGKLEAEGPRVADVGSGAGFVGICFKIARPEASVALIESSYRKFCFLNWTSVRLGLRRFEILHERAQKTAERNPAYDAVLARALAPLPEAVGIAGPLAVPGGIVAVFQSRPPDVEDRELARAMDKAGCGLEDCAEYRLPGEDAARCLAIFRRKT